MNGSGCWLPASAVLEATKIRMDEMLSYYIKKRDNCIWKETKYKWSWRDFGFVPVEKTKINIEYDVYCWFAEKPTRNENYKRMSDLYKTAECAEDLIEGAQIFVSSEDAGLLHHIFKRKDLA